MIKNSCSTTNNTTKKCLLCLFTGIAPGHNLSIQYLQLKAITNRTLTHRTQIQQLKLGTVQLLKLVISV